MSDTPSLLLTDWNGVRDSLAQLAESHDSVARFLGDLFQQLDGMWMDVVRRQRAWQADREQIKRDLDARAAQLDEQRAALAVERERLREQVQREIQDELRRVQQEHAAQEQERIALETELETVRTRAAELADSLAQQGRQIAEERTQWNDELKRMRRALESLARHPAESAPDERPAIAEARRPEAVRAAAVSATGEDPVLSSVMAQFEMLQKDLARRRKNGTTG